MKILVVDDDLELRGLIGFALRQAGYLVVEAGDGPRALEVFEREQPQLVILDVNLPGLDGFEVCRRLRESSRVPVMLLTVRNTEEDEVRGLDLGADDFLTKPFSPRTLLARARALLRRGEPGAEPRAHAAGDLALDLEAQAVSVRGGPAVRLTGLEFRLLHYLLANAGRTLTAEQLTQHVWGYPAPRPSGGLGAGGADRQLLKQLVHRLRQKIEADPAEPAYLVTVPGLGYSLQPGPR